jgi:hypothetical protein
MRTGTALRAGTAVLAGLLAAAGLTACSGSDPKPGTLSPSPSPSTSNASPSPSATTPEQQIEAAVRAYYAELLKGVQTSDASGLRPLVTKSCPCFSAVKTLDENRAKGLSGPDAELTLASVEVHDVEKKLAGAKVDYSVGAYGLVNSNGDIVQQIKARHDVLDLTLVLAPGGSWRIANVANLDAS